MNDLEFVGDYRNPQQLAARRRETGLDGQSDGDFSFGDFIDIINPLQHIPLVSTLYREITGDEISPHARILGDTLFGGPAGFLSSIANVFYEEVAGEDLGETVIALFGGEEDTAEPQFAESGAAGENTPPDAGLVPLATAAGPEAAGPITPSGLPLPPLADPEAAGMLTGQAALNALFNDLRRTPASPQAAAPSLPPNGARAEAMPLTARDTATPQPAVTATPDAADTADTAGTAGTGAGEPAAVHPLILAQDAPNADIAERMMEALDKYRRMNRQSRAEPPQKEDEARWQSDPAPNDPWRFDPTTPAGT